MYSLIFHAAVSPSAPLEMPTEAALQLFGFKQAVSDKVLKARYHELALQTHPDHCQAAGCVEGMQQLNAAYQVLKKKVQ